ncbi:MAG: hypothetical protein H0V80_08785 [Acidobacteria bacterium]|nr:hypothetical protein [Acidobacteriota bacterium]
MAGGLVLGVVVAFAGTLSLRRVLFDVPPHDTVVFTTTVLVFLVVGVIASALPAWRAGRVDAARALRSE